MVPSPGGAAERGRGAGARRQACARGGGLLDDANLVVGQAVELVDGRFFDDYWTVRVSGGKLEYYNSDGARRQTVLEPVRMGKGVVQADLTYRANVDAGFIVHYQGPEDFLAVVLYHDGSSLVFACLYEFKDGASGNLLDWDGGFTLTDNTPYTLKCVIDDDPNNSALQRLRFYVGGTLRLTSFAVDDTWPGGRVGLIRLTSPTTTTLQWDNFKVGKDNTSNGSIDDGGDYVFASFDFGGSHLTINLGYDNNGNLTDDGSLRYRYDGWNRLVRACYNAQDPNDPNQCFAQYSYLADGRRSEKVVTLRGAEAVANDGGNQTVRFLYGSSGGGGDPPWSIFETRNGSNQSTWQYVWGTQYIDEIVLADKNGDATASNDCNPDVTATGEGSESPADHRYFYHQDRNWNVVALTDYDGDPNAAANGSVIERYSHTRADDLGVHKAAVGDTELGATRLYSSFGMSIDILRAQNERRLGLLGTKGSFRGDLGRTWCDPSGIPQSEVYREHCAGNCVRQHENTHKSDIESCCQRYGLCVRRFGEHTCQARWLAWTDAITNWTECRGYGVEADCLSGLIFWGCGVFHTIDCDCCDELRRRLLVVRRVVNDVCSRPDAQTRKRCPFDSAGNIRTSVVIGELP